MTRAEHWAELDRLEYHSFRAQREFGPNYATNSQYLEQKRITDEWHAKKAREAVAA